MASWYRPSRIKNLSEAIFGFAKIVFDLQCPPYVVLGDVQVAVGIAELLRTGAKEEVNGGRKVKSAGVLIVELDRLADVLERESRLASVKVVVRQVVLGLGLTLRVDAGSVGALESAGRRRGPQQANEREARGCTPELQKRHMPQVWGITLQAVAKSTAHGAPEDLGMLIWSALFAGLRARSQAGPTPEADVRSDAPFARRCDDHVSLERPASSSVVPRRTYSRRSASRSAISMRSPETRR